jgi:hypothetical protein
MNNRSKLSSGSEVKGEARMVGEEANPRFVLTYAQQTRWLSTFVRPLHSHRFNLGQASSACISSSYLTYTPPPAPSNSTFNLYNLLANFSLPSSFFLIPSLRNISDSVSLCRAKRSLISIARLRDSFLPICWMCASSGPAIH